MTTLVRPSAELLERLAAAAARRGDWRSAIAQEGDYADLSSAFPDALWVELGGRVALETEASSDLCELIERATANWAEMLEDAAEAEAQHPTD